MDLLDIITLINFILRVRVAEAPLLTPKNVGLLLHSASIRHFKRKIGLPEEYQPGMPLPRQAYDLTQKISEDLRIFKVNMDGVEKPLLFFTSGSAQLPSNYYYPSSIAALVEIDGQMVFRKAYFKTDDEWDEMEGSYVDVPNEEYPVVNIQANKIRIAPQVSRARFTYLRLPVKPVYRVTIDGHLNKYDQANSTQLEWDQINTIDVLTILLADLGVSMLRQDVLQYAEMKKQQGV